MAVVSEAATASVEKSLTCKRLRIKIGARKPVIPADGFSKKVPMMNSLIASGDESTNVSVNRKLNSSTVGTKRKLERAEESEKEKILKMTRYGTWNCKVILGKLIKHRLGSPFKIPVNPVVLQIPDYFDIIKNPMDLGTIMKKLDDNKYRNVEAFESDVRLTFSNAMQYNPPDNFVHQYARELMKIFYQLWTPLKEKINTQSEGTKQLSSQKVIDESTLDSDRKCVKKFPGHAVKSHGLTTSSNEINPGELRIISSKTEVKGKRPSENMKQLSRQKTELITHDVTQKCRESSSSTVHKFPGKKLFPNKKDHEELTDFSNKKEEEINRHCKSMKLASSHKINDETTLDASRKCLKRSFNYLDKLPAQEMLSNVKDPQELTGCPLRKRKVQMRDNKDVNDVKAKGYTSSKICSFDDGAGGENSKISLARPAYSVVKGKSEGAKELTRAMMKPHDEIKVLRVKKNSAPQLSRYDQDSYGDSTCLDEEHACTTSGATASCDATIEGLKNILDIQLSPSKALRAAKLKSRFADTILKAQQKTLLQSGGRTDFVKLQQEKEMLERKQREERAKIEAQIKAAESAARLKAKSELQIRREQERMALEKMEQSAGLEDNFHAIRELESLIGVPLLVLCKSRDGRSQAAYLWDKVEADQLRSPLEQLGLFIKADDDDEEALQEEGEMEEGELAF